MKVYGIIPARMASTRFPGKPMESILGIPMIGHVYYRSRFSELLDEVYVATCDQVIFDYITGIGGKAVMTLDSHERCTDRTAEALLKIESEKRERADIVVMIQGDEPMIIPQMIDDAVKPILEDEDVLITNLAGELKDETEHDDPNEVKVVMDQSMNALYFSREPIPSRKKFTGDLPPVYKQVCIIPFRRDFLIEFNRMKPTPLEIVESVDMLRILEHGYKIRVIPTDNRTYSVDTEQDRNRVEELMINDTLISQYHS
ncbi:3-deoxy-manno-octulosonate cytidylyltransferase [uncultured Desulfosarcina sp.]|uniref:3-deoxy-manno-octulosonate cytidylyltransferase n=1 Tax=uncultured Desulfosarcina sp. TaxID=218289 RepID=UPI0029C64026|nr:3-deoxy-manno-octulosonate cytidylyltransferase [uncultured Desulfosarcina sp.]